MIGHQIQSLPRGQGIDLGCVANAAMRYGGAQRAVERFVAVAGETAVDIERAVDREHAAGGEHAADAVEQGLDFGPAHDVQGVRAEHGVTALQGPWLLRDVQAQIQQVLELNNQFYPGRTLSLSIGLAVCRAGESLEAALQAADRAMYDDKARYYEQHPPARRRNDRLPAA